MTSPSSKTRPVDHGYAWIALASCAVIRSLVNGIWSSLGVIFVNWEEYFDVSPAQTSYVGSAFLLLVWGIGKFIVSERINSIF